MVLGIHRKPQKKPDLSRYDYHYQQKDSTGGGHALSAAAAGAAGRSRSLVHPPARANHGVSGTPYTRSYSMRHPSSNGTSRRRPATNGALGSRTSSLLGSAGQTRRAVSGPTTGSRTNSLASPSRSITVKTTEVRDPMGRTQSITRQTVRKINGYEYVETTTTSTTTSPLGDAERHFDEFTSDFTHGETLEEEDNEDGDAENDEDGTEYSDAIDVLPSPPPQRAQRQASPREAKPKRSALPRKALTEQEQYAKALAAAQRKVYGDRAEQKVAAGSMGPTGTSGRKSRRVSSLRDPVVPSEPARHEGPAPGSTRRNTMRRSFSQVISPSRRTEAPADAPVPSPQTQPQRRMNDDEIYAKALEIARKKFAADSMEEPREIPEAQSAQKPDLYQEAPVSTQQPASDAAQRGPPRSRVKSFFSKVAQFSQENYGYQDKKNEPVANASTQASRPAGTGSSAQAEPQTSTLYSMDSNVSRRSMRGSASGPLQSSAVSSEPVRIAAATPPETEETVPAPQVMKATTANSSPAATGPVPTKQVKVGFFQRLFKRSR
ncbi:Msc3p [Lachancea thermotolerans CBS 6340]|uniref:KLTH0E10230p n=1 Tax=Lachancea thermotolerans (strain ATCC 56472 / CBS 6340 / NRRL Y-8284) TaxID=559295 RepID=C5DI73_LACTC|nr:KLTH0E10230p [Lachancea thermotolerans CBS 6340]CAR23484.1 KLTH0E10230p [Lachancea thermotolerans CBS 6340]